MTEHKQILLMAAKMSIPEEDVDEIIGAAIEYAEDHELPTDDRDFADHIAAFAMAVKIFGIAGIPLRDER